MSSHEGRCGLDYIYPCLMSHEPVDLLVIMLGTNDTKERFGSSAACIALGLKRLVEKAIEHNRKTAEHWNKPKRRPCSLSGTEAPPSGNQKFLPFQPHLLASSYFTYCLGL